MESSDSTQRCSCPLRLELRYQSTTRYWISNAFTFIFEFLIHSNYTNLPLLSSDSLYEYLKLKTFVNIMSPKQMISFACLELPWSKVLKERWRLVGRRSFLRIAFWLVTNYRAGGGGEEFQSRLTTEWIFITVHRDGTNPIQVWKTTRISSSFHVILVQIVDK